MTEVHVREACTPYLEKSPSSKQDPRAAEIQQAKLFKKKEEEEEECLSLN